MEYPSIPAPAERLLVAHNSFSNLMKWAMKYLCLVYSEEKQIEAMSDDEVAQSGTSSAPGGSEGSWIDVWVLGLIAHVVTRRITILMSTDTSNHKDTQQ